MVYAIIGESCTGKSTLAEKLKEKTNAEIYTGKDYLRLAKNENIARKLFEKKLNEAVAGENIIYVIAEKEHLSLIPAGAVRILVKADLSVIKERFRQRMRGNLPAPVERMLEMKHGCFDDIEKEFVLVSGVDDGDQLIQKVTE